MEPTYPSKEAGCSRLVGAGKPHKSSLIFIAQVASNLNNKIVGDFYPEELTLSYMDHVLCRR